jgi:hypothetical protein
MEGLGEGPSYVRIFSKAWVVHTLPVEEDTGQWQLAQALRKGCKCKGPEARNH